MAIQQLFIVESPNDAAFVRLLIEKVPLPMAAVEIIDLHKFPDPDGSGKELRGKTALAAKLATVKTQLEKQYPKVEKIGIILDIDDEGLDANLADVNAAVARSFEMEMPFDAEAQFRVAHEKDADFDVQIACFFTKGYLADDGTVKMDKGNLDTLLYAIRSNPETKVPYADCLALWRDCVNTSDSQIKVTENQFTKMWLDNYLRSKAKSDLTSKETKRILADFEAKKTDVMHDLGAAIFDLDHSALVGFRAFIEMFK